jgi:glucosamine-6-phosphate deaminase
MAAPIRTLPSPEAIGDYLAPRLLQRIEVARVTGRRFLLGCPTGRTPRPIYGAIAQLLEKTHQDISSTVLVMMDEYLVSEGGEFRYADERNPWTSRHFVGAQMADRWNNVLPTTHRLRHESIWFPDPDDPGEYDERIAEAGGIDFFILASGASDGHVAFNPPGSSRDSRTRIIALSEETRRDNLQTFPAFGALEAVPRHGISVGIDTIATARESAMVVWGAGKRSTLERMRKATSYEPQWPATVIHECRAGEIVCDAAAANTA